MFVRGEFKKILSKPNLSCGVLLSKRTPFNHLRNTFISMSRRVHWSYLLSSDNWSEYIWSGSSGPVSTTLSQSEACWSAFALEETERQCNPGKMQRPRP